MSAAELPVLSQGVLEGLSDGLAPELRWMLALASMSFIPLLVIATTAFTRIIIVLSLLRQALGVPQTPPNSVLIVLALFLTLFAMSGVIAQINLQAVQPYLTGQLQTLPALEQGLQVLKAFMLAQTNEQHYLKLLQMAGQTPPAQAQDVALLHLVPAYMLSELTMAFKIAFLIFLPFLLIDLVVASSLMALGMIMLPPVTVALPLKILLFVMIDGWVLLAGSLVAGIHGAGV
jgi:flagellar biosynthetic protein FliP